MTDPTPLSPAAQAVLDATGMQGTPQEKDFAFFSFAELTPTKGGGLTA